MLNEAQITIVLLHGDVVVVDCHRLVFLVVSSLPTTSLDRGCISVGASRAASHGARVGLFVAHLIHAGGRLIPSRLTACRRVSMLASAGATATLTLHLLACAVATLADERVVLAFLGLSGVGGGGCTLIT